MSKNFLSPIPLKFCVENCKAIKITNSEFHQNRRQKFSIFPKGGPFGIFLIFKKSSKGPPFESEKIFCLRFHSNFMCDIPKS